MDSFQLDVDSRSAGKRPSRRPGEAGHEGHDLRRCRADAHFRAEGRAQYIVSLRLKGTRPGELGSSSMSSHPEWRATRSRRRFTPRRSGTASDSLYESRKAGWGSLCMSIARPTLRRLRRSAFVTRRVGQPRLRPQLPLPADSCCSRPACLPMHRSMRSRFADVQAIVRPTPSSRLVPASNPSSRCAFSGLPKRRIE